MSQQRAGRHKAGPRVGSRWEAQAAEAFTDLRGWRGLHPRASLREIEQELDRRWEQVRATVLADLALASAAADLQQGEGVARPTCPDCGVALLDQGSHPRTLRTLGDQAVELRRDYGTCPRCGGGLFPPGR